ncbi:MAG: hypothetical protein KBT69_14175 [Oceanihabitans sp.]|nr:hypothetical protein [Oceanihabitans sp.]
MAPIKFEENIREKLEQRTIEPSINTWESLEQRLNADEKKQSKNTFLWFGIAASVIGFLFVVSQFVTLDTTSSNVSPIVVDAEMETITNPSQTSEILLESQEVVQEQVKTSEKKNLNTIPTNNSVAENTVQKTIRNQKIKQPIVNKKAIASNAKKAPKDISTIGITQDEVIASVVKTEGILGSKENQIVSTNLETTDSEIEALLQTANKKMQLSANNGVQSIAVDANALLEDAETEMPPSLRGKLFKVIEENFKTATTAVATRNE